MSVGVRVITREIARVVAPPHFKGYVMHAGIAAVTVTASGSEGPHQVIAPVLIADVLQNPAPHMATGVTGTLLKLVEVGNTNTQRATITTSHVPQPAQGTPQTCGIRLSLNFMIGIDHCHPGDTQPHRTECLPR